MRYQWLDEYLLQKRGVTKDFQPVWNWVRYHIGGKMFAAVCLDKEGKPYYINLKLDPMEGELLRGEYEDILPGYYSDKQWWNSVRPDGAVPDDLLREMLDKSYGLVLGGLSKKAQRLALARPAGNVTSTKRTALAATRAWVRCSTLRQGKPVPSTPALPTGSV